VIQQGVAFLVRDENVDGVAFLGAVGYSD